jgi:hypothetical protein
MRPRALEAPVGDGALVAMEAAREPSNDVVNHTLRHWLSTRRELDAWQPSQALRAGFLPAEEGRRRVVEAGARWADLEALGLDPGPVIAEPQWWRAPLRAAVQEAHDRGYWRIYLGAVRRHGLPGQRRCAGWTRQGGGRWQLDTEDGLIVFGVLQGERRMGVASAHASAVRPQAARAYAPDPDADPVGALLARRGRRRR